MHPEEARKKVLDRLEHLSDLAEKYFPDNKNFAREAVEYATDALNKAEWICMCDYRGGSFTEFITPLLRKLLVDFIRNKVLEQWGYLSRLAGERFPEGFFDKKDPKLSPEAMEAMDHVMNAFEKNEWKCVRDYSGRSTFTTFITSVFKRSLSDFTRSKFGHIRPPAWLKREKDPIWEKAYYLWARKRYSRQDCIEELLRIFDRERWFIEQVVARVNAKCSQQQYKEQNLSIDPLDDDLNDGNFLADESPYQMRADLDKNALIEVLRRLLDANGQKEGTENSLVEKFFAECRQFVRLNSEEKLILRMYYLSGLSDRKITEHLGLSGDVVRRRRTKAYKRLKEAFMRTGFELD